MAAATSTRWLLLSLACAEGLRADVGWAAALVHSKPSPAMVALEPEAPLVEFPAPLSASERISRTATFWARTVPVIASYLRVYTGLQLKEQLFGQCLSQEECELVWQEQHERGADTLANAIGDLRGFFVKVGQIIASRQDLFPAPYIERLAGLTDFLDPMPAELTKAVIEQELLLEGETFEDVFVEFDDEPLGAASVAQVHRAVLSPKYGGGEVAVKVQRPAIEAKLMGDIAALKALAFQVRGIKVIPIDYYTVFSELEAQLADEFDFVKESLAMERIGNALAHGLEGEPCIPSIVTPRPVAGLVTRRVLVMDFFRGEPLSRAVETMRRRGIDPESAEAKAFGRKLLSALTEAFGKTILGTGFFHADPHPGNIFVLDDGRIGLIDFGQVRAVEELLSPIRGCASFLAWTRDPPTRPGATCISMPVAMSACGTRPCAHPLWLLTLCAGEADLTPRAHHSSSGDARARQSGC